MTPLESLQFHWGSAYHIWRGVGGTWCARRREDPKSEPLVAYSAGDLRQMIRADYRPTGVSASPR